MTLYQKIFQLISRQAHRALVSLIPSEDTGNVQIVQIQYQGGGATAETIAPYGFASRAPVGSQAMVWNVLGQNDNKVCMSYDFSTRFKGLKPGETAVGNQVTGANVKFNAEGGILITAPKAIDIMSESDKINLGEGGPAIARLGDTVEITIPSGSSAGTYQGTIISAGNNTST